MGAYFGIKGHFEVLGSFVANDKIDLSVEKGTIHAIVGGKRRGEKHPDECPVRDLQPGRGGNPDRWPGEAFSLSHCCQIDIRIVVYQEFMLFPELSVLDNIIMGYEKTSCPGVIDRKASEAAVEEICREYSFHIPLT